MTLDLNHLAAVLPEWLAQQRWFAGKGRPIARVTVVADAELTTRPDPAAPDPAAPDPAAPDPHDPELHDLVVRVDYADGGREHYQVLIAARTADGDGAEPLKSSVLFSTDDRVVYAADQDPAMSAWLLERLATPTDAGFLRFANSGEPIETGLPARLIGGEQSNSSLVFGESYILKLFRRIAPGVNPDLEMTRALATAGSAQVAPPLGWIEAELALDPGQPATPVTLGLMAPFLRFGSDGWALATTSVRDLYAEGDLHADEVGGDFAAESERLGAATALVHRDLAAAFGTLTLSPAEVDELGAAMRARLDEACAVVPELRPYAEDLAAAFDELGQRVGPVAVQRIHGDLHLGQVMRTETGWVVLDFEGEPNRPLAERRAMASPVRDVAGMARSFDYAARHLLLEQPPASHLDYRAGEWAQRNRSAFCDGYARESGIDPREPGDLLRAFELDKAVYEVVYEARNRPSWLTIPLGTIRRLAGPGND